MTWFEKYLYVHADHILKFSPVHHTPPTSIFRTQNSTFLTQLIHCSAIKFRIYHRRNITCFQATAPLSAKYQSTLFFVARFKEKTCDTWRVLTTIVTRSLEKTGIYWLSCNKTRGKRHYRSKSRGMYK